MHEGAESAFKLVHLANGVQAVHSIAEGETMHPGLGPVAEAEALHLGQLRLPERISKSTRALVVWDIGLGAAANVLALIRLAGNAGGALRIVSFDHTTSPLAFGLDRREELGYFGGFEASLAGLLRERTVRFQYQKLQVEWSLELGDFPKFLSSRRSGISGGVPAPDAVLFDPYSPAKNPAMWTASLFTDLFAWLEPDRPCALTTYSRSTSVRVALLLAGFFVGAGRGVGSKEETTVAASVRELVPNLLDRNWLDRARRSHAAEPLRDANYRQAPLSAESWEQLRRHAQFK